MRRAPLEHQVIQGGASAGPVRETTRKKRFGSRRERVCGAPGRPDRIEFARGRWHHCDPRGQRAFVEPYDGLIEACTPKPPARGAARQRTGHWLATSDGDSAGRLRHEPMCPQSAGGCHGLAPLNVTAPWRVGVMQLNLVGPGGWLRPSLQLDDEHPEA